MTHRSDQSSPIPDNGDRPQSPHFSETDSEILFHVDKDQSETVDPEQSSADNGDKITQLVKLREQLSVMQRAEADLMNQIGQASASVETPITTTRSVPSSVVASVLNSPPRMSAGVDMVTASVQSKRDWRHPYGLPNPDVRWRDAPVRTGEGSFESPRIDAWSYGLQPESGLGQRRGVLAGSRERTHVQHRADSNQSHKPKRPANYDGKTSWRDYLVQFEMIAELNGWNNAMNWRLVSEIVHRVFWQISIQIKDLVLKVW